MSKREFYNESVSYPPSMRVVPQLLLFTIQFSHHTGERYRFNMQREKIINILHQVWRLCHKASSKSISHFQVELMKD